MRKILAITLMLIFSLNICLSAYAQGDSQEYTPEQQKAVEQLTQKYNELYEKNGMDPDSTLDALLATSDSLSVVNSSRSYGYIINDELVVLNQQLRSDPSYISFSDDIVYDSDWGTYVYFGTWDWTSVPNDGNLQPWDMVGIYSQNASKIRAREMIVRGYNIYGSRTVYYNTDSNTREGEIQKGIDNLDATAFWLNEAKVDNGQITAPLYYSNTSETAKIMIQYAHSWTQSSLTGIGGDIGIGSGGFSVSWDSGVSSWPSVISSYGTSLGNM